MRAEKQSMIQEIRGRLEDGGFVILADYRGLRAHQLTDLRAKLRQEKAKFKVTSNALLGRAAADTGRKGLDDFLKGPTAMITGQGDITIVAKVLRTYTQENNKLPVIKGGILGGLVLQPGDVAALAELPPKEVLQAQLVGTIAAPMTRLAGVLSQKVSSLLYVLKAVEEKKTKEGKN